MRGKRYRYKYNRGAGAHTFTISPNESTFNEFKKKWYKDELREAANNGELSLDDIFNEYGKKDKIRLRFYVYGYDAETNTRRIFESKFYRYNEIKDGKYNKAKLLENKSQDKEYIEKTLKVIKK